MNLFLLIAALLYHCRIEVFSYSLSPNILSYKNSSFWNSNSKKIAEIIEITRKISHIRPKRPV